MIKRLLLACIIIVFANIIHAQERKDPYLPHFGIKTNALYWATTTPNLGIELGLSKKTTLEISGTYNPWKFSDNKRLRNWLVQPEFRYWPCERFNGHFFGLHGHYAEFNIGGIKMLGLKDRRYQGHLYGGGISYGYHWILGNHWSIEATLGVGYAHIDYDKYGCHKCNTKVKDDDRNYWGPTKVGISLIYIIK